MHIRMQELPSVFLMALTHLWGARRAATGRADDAFLNEIQARRHWWQAEVGDLDRVWLRLSSLGKGWGSRWCDWWVLPVSALGEKKRGCWGSDEHKWQEHALSLPRYRGRGRAAHLSRIKGDDRPGHLSVSFEGGLWKEQTDTLSSRLVERASEKAH